MTSIHDKKLRILVVAHGHPDLSKGGGEIAAYNQFAGMRTDDRVEACWFLGAKPDEAVGGITMLREGEYIWKQGVANAFLMKSAVPASTFKDFSALLLSLRPDVIHFHHYVHLGLDSLVIARRMCPDAKIVMTLHEMLAICLNDGQMVKTGNGGLCYKADDYSCHDCFKEFSPEDFWLRKRYFLEHFSLVDQFSAPSNFLAQRYIDWGIPASKISVVENGLHHQSSVKQHVGRAAGAVVRIGFFGQITRYKGVDILLESLAMVGKENRKRLLVEIHGANLEVQLPEFQDKIRGLLDPLVKKGVVRMFGSYSREEIAKRMGGVDWVVVPSIWWENSPLVIQEAFSLSKPVICADIGGMAEKVRDGIDGVHFFARSGASLAGVLSDIAEGTLSADMFKKNIVCKSGLKDCVDNYLRLYRLS